MNREMTLELRLALKREMDRGDRVTTEKRSKSLPELLENRNNETLRVLNTSPSLGSGVYGEARLLGDNVVAKVTGCGSYLLGNIYQSPFRAEHVEPSMINYLWRHLVSEPLTQGLPCITPHLIAPFGSHAILEGATASALVKQADLNTSLVFFMERATRNTLRSYLATIWDAQRFDLHCRVLLFQVCYTLQCIYERWPRFRHNDLKDDNVFLHSSRNDGGHVSYEIGRQHFSLPRIGVTALISDFDFSCITGHMLDNYKVLEQEWDTPTYNINGNQNQSADIYSLIHYIWKQGGTRISRALNTDFEALYGPFQDTNSLRLYCHQRAPSVADILFRSSLFAAFRTRADNNYHDETYVSTWDERVYPMPPAPLHHMIFEERHCPILLADCELPSFVYFRQCPSADPALDSEASVCFSPLTANPILAAIRKAYHSQQGTLSAESWYGLDPARCDECMSMCNDRATVFLQDHRIPYRWWCAAFTCAFIDCANELGLFRANQRCWYISLWVEFWQRQGLVRYTGIQMLHFALQWKWQ